MEQNAPECSHVTKEEPESASQTTKPQDNKSGMSSEITSHIFDGARSTTPEAPKPFSLPYTIYQSSTPSEMTAHTFDDARPTTSDPPKPFSLPYTISRINDSLANASIPLLFLRSSFQSPISSQPRFSNLPSPISLNLNDQPQSLFLQALSKLNENSISFAFINHLKSQLPQSRAQMASNVDKSGDLSPPDSITSAPPSYSFVLRQSAIRRRPRLMGTFIPSPSFVQHTPPPNYATAFDIYVDNPLPPPPTRAYNFGFASMPVVCPECGYTGMTLINSKVTICTHLCSCVLCLFCCWICAPLPYILRSCKNVYHYCRNCRNFLGMYCPTNPDNNYP